jgi:hypothetical protein
MRREYKKKLEDLDLWKIKRVGVAETGVYGAKTFRS